MRSPLIVRDGSGTTVLKSADAYIKRVPNGSLGKEISTREWTIHCGTLECDIGGNAGGTLDPNLYTITFGTIPIVGWADGEVLRWERKYDSFTDYQGTDGEDSRVRVISKAGTVTFILKQTSPTNDSLSAAHKADTYPSTL
jgi:hypothetical protein